MEISSIPRKGITLAEGPDLKARSEAVKNEQETKKVDYAIQAFNFKLMNQPDVLSQIDLIRNAGNFELGSPNVDRLSDTNSNQQRVAMPEDVSKALKEFANQLAPGIIDSALDSLFNPHHDQEIKDQFVEATSYIRDQLEAAVTNGPQNVNYGSIYANMQSLKELAFQHGEALLLQKKYSEGTYEKNIEGYQSSLTIDLARAANRLHTIQNDNRDEAFKDILKTSSDKVFDKIYKTAEEHLGKDLRSAKGYNKLYNDIFQYDSRPEGWLVRKQPISVFV